MLGGGRRKFSRDCIVSSRSILRSENFSTHHRDELVYRSKISSNSIELLDRAQARGTSQNASQKLRAQWRERLPPCTRLHNSTKNTRHRGRSRPWIEVTLRTLQEIRTIEMSAQNHRPSSFFYEAFALSRASGCFVHGQIRVVAHVSLTDDYSNDVSIERSSVRFVTKFFHPFFFFFFLEFSENSKILKKILRSDLFGFEVNSLTPTDSTSISLKKRKLGEVSWSNTRTCYETAHVDDFPIFTVTRFPFSNGPGTRSKEKNGNFSRIYVYGGAAGDVKQDERTIGHD